MQALVLDSSARAVSGIAAKHFLRKAFARHGRPDRVVIRGSRTNQEAITARDGEDRLRDRSRRALKSTRILQSQYLNNRIEQDHRRIERRVRSMLGFKSTISAANILDGIEMIHMMRKRQARYAYNPAPFARRTIRDPRCVRRDQWIGITHLLFRFATAPPAALGHDRALPGPGLATLRCAPGQFPGRARGNGRADSFADQGDRADARTRPTADRCSGRSCWNPHAFSANEKPRSGCYGVAI